MSRTKILKRLVAGVALAACSVAHAALISAGSPTTSVPDYLGTGPLGADEFLLPILVSDAAGLQTWQFDLGFNPLVVAQIEPLFTPYSFGLYAAQFDPLDPSTLASPTSAGFSLTPGLIEGISGFSQSATGDGPLVYLAFKYLDPNGAPDFAVSNVTIAQSVPEPGALPLLGLALAGLVVQRLRGLAGARPAPDTAAQA